MLEDYEAYIFRIKCFGDPNGPRLSTGRFRMYQNIAPYDDPDKVEFWSSLQGYMVDNILKPLESSAETRHRMSLNRRYNATTSQYL